MDTNAKLYQDMTKILVKREDIQKAVASWDGKSPATIRAAIW